MILKVKHAMNSQPQTVDTEATVTDAAHMMIQSGEDALIVLDGGRIKGIVDLRNIVRYTYTQGFRPNQTPVSEITNSNIILARPNTSFEDVLAIMTETRLYTLPVVDNKLVGSINLHDLLKSQQLTKPLPATSRMA